eukprot:1317616-Prymnesium_polylepis.1
MARRGQSSSQRRASNARLAHLSPLPLLFSAFALRDECLYCLALIARLGGAPLLQPVGTFVNLLGGGCHMRAREAGRAYGASHAWESPVARMARATRSEQQLVV